ncbi:Myb-like DNA-binding domain containing protein [Histomonas meleagridis]|uniref:Myb-like DNA-binding domain containing protein n=1 Tax=Histomonas meleagridis TaxID=135588 RepID=UPI00355983BC|nr:Myb-like DNA-binding domain containing protein [Histomonas meleagridis]KAH0798514.1 Myb-like DNA-binding domain containing protein [Histomonas meleagridis]
MKKSQTQWTATDDELLISLVENTRDPIWEKISLRFPNKTIQQVSDRWNKVLNPELIKGSWSPDEDQKIIKWVEENGPKNWSILATQLPGRLGKQCRERWINSLDPDLLRKPWTEEEDKILIEHQKLWGNKWAKISSLLPGRTDNSVKNRWNSSLKRKLDRIAKGENPVQKRGRKPKRPSNAPTLIETENHVNVSNNNNEQLPKPDFNIQEQESIPSPELPTFSPILISESPFNAISPTKFSTFSSSSPFSLLSPNTGFLLKSPEMFAIQSPIKLNLDMSDTQNHFDNNIKKD